MELKTPHRRIPAGSAPLAAPTPAIGKAHRLRPPTVTIFVEEDLQMRNGNVIHSINRDGDKRRLSIYYDRRPKTSAERDRRVCLLLKSSGQVIRFSEAEALDIIENMSRTLKKKQLKAWH